MPPWNAISIDEYYTAQHQPGIVFSGSAGDWQKVFDSGKMLLCKDWSYHFILIVRLEVVLGRNSNPRKNLAKNHRKFTFDIEPTARQQLLMFCVIFLISLLLFL